MITSIAINSSEGNRGNRLRVVGTLLKVQSGQMRELADRNADLEARLATLETLLLNERLVAGRLQ